MEVITQEGPVKEEKEVEDKKEILPDGTVHHYRRERSSSFKNIQKCVTTEEGDICVLEESKEILPGSFKESVLETFEEPARCVHEERDYDEVLDNGRTVHKHVTVNRLEHHIHMHQESFDSRRGRLEEDFDIDEVVPGTESTFVVCDGDDDDDSDSFDGDGSSSNDE